MVLAVTSLTTGGGGLVMVTTKVTCDAAVWLASPASFAVMVHAPAESVVTVAPWMEHTAADDAATAKTTGLLDPSPVAETINVPLGLNTGCAGVAIKLVITPTALGVTLLDAAEGVPVPAALVAATVKVYAVPLVKPVTVHGDAVQVPVIALGILVAVYEVMASPPLLLGGVKVTLACASPAVAVPMLGAPGATPPMENDCVTCVAA